MAGNSTQSVNNVEKKLIGKGSVRGFVILVDISHLVSCPRSKWTFFRDLFSALMKRKLFFHPNSRFIRVFSATAFALVLER